MVECPECGNTSEFRVVVTSQKVFTRVYDEEGDLIQNELLKFSSDKLETWLCVECGALVNDPFEGSEESKKLVENNASSKKASKGSKKKRDKRLTKEKKKPGKAKPSDSDGKPTEKQLKYLNDLAEKLGLGEEETEDFNELSKKEVSDKLTELYKECKKKGIE